MFKYISLFVCLLGVSLASEVSGLEEPEVKSLLEAVETHREYLDVCEDVIGVAVKSCADLLDDLATLESDVSGAVSTGLSVYTQAVEIMAEFTTCGTKSIFKQVACYEKVLTAAKALATTAEGDMVSIEEELTTDVSQLESDLASCVSSAYTSQTLNSKMAQCKLRLMLKN